MFNTLSELIRSSGDRTVRSFDKDFSPFRKAVTAKLPYRASHPVLNRNNMFRKNFVIIIIVIIVIIVIIHAYEFFGSFSPLRVVLNTTPLWALIGNSKK